MIKIVFVTSYIVNNGPGKVILNIINNLNPSVYAISLITLFSGNDPKIVSELKKQNIYVYECKSLSRIKCLLGFSSEFSKLISKNNFDIIHSHGLIPDIISGRLKSNITKISTLHNNMFEDYYETYGAFKSDILTKMHLHYLKKLDKCVCCSESVFDVMKKHLKKILYIRNGITIQETNNNHIERNQFGIPENGVVFIFVGMLNNRKNTEWLIRQFVKHHNNEEYLLVLGDGPERKKCEAVSDNHVKLLGFQSNPFVYYKISNIYVSASKAEGFSISVLEALSEGLGLMLSDIPSHNEMFKIDNNIYLGENFLFSEFKTKMNVLRKKYGGISRKAISEFHEKYLSGSSMANQYDKVYRFGK